MAYEPKTTKTKASVTEFIAKLPREETRRDCTALVKMMKRVTGKPAAMWGPSIVGFGEYTYVYASGHTGDWPVAAFSPRKQDLVLYVLQDFAGAPALLKKLGRIRTGKVCLYLKALADVDQAALEELVAKSMAEALRRYPATPAKREATKKVVKRKVVKAVKRATGKKGARKAPVKPAKRTAR